MRPIKDKVRARLARIADRPERVEREGGFISMELLRDVLLGFVGEYLGHLIRLAIIALAAFFGWS